MGLGILARRLRKEALQQITALVDPQGRPGLQFWRFGLGGYRGCLRIIMLAGAFSRLFWVYWILTSVHRLVHLRLPLVKGASSSCAMPCAFLPLLWVCAQVTYLFAVLSGKAHPFASFCVEGPFVRKPVLGCIS